MLGGTKTRKEVAPVEPGRPHDRIELLAYLVDFARELLNDTSMSLRLYGLVIVVTLSCGLTLGVVGSIVLLLSGAPALATGTSAAVATVPIAIWSARRTWRCLTSRRER
jgi:hypothetical protein